MMKRWLRVAIVLFGCVLAWQCVAATPTPATSASAKPMVARIALDGPIGPAAAEYFHNASQRAQADGAAAIVLRLDTPGGLSSSMRQIISDMLASPIPVLAYVAPGGARAASAGTYILYAAQVAAMAPATHLGAATPVSLGGSTPMPKDLTSPAKPASSAKSGDRGDAESHKVLNDAIAYVRSLAQLRGRNADWAEQAVRGAATLTASEALDKHVIDLIATNTNNLLSEADGRQVKVGEKMLTLRLKGATVRDYAPGWRTAFLAIITNPTIAYLLLLAGIIGLFLEATHPGVLFPGIVGAISLLVGLYALQLLPVSYAGLALMALGVGLLVAEGVHPTVGALGIGGVIAFVLGSVMLMNTNVPGYVINLGVIAGIAVAATAMLVWLLWLVFRSRRLRRFNGGPSTQTEIGQLIDPVAAGGEAWAAVHGERWRIRCDTALPAGARVRIVRREGLLLWAEPV